MAPVAVQTPPVQVNSIIDKYDDTLKYKKSRPTTIQVELRNPDGIKEAFGEDYSQFLPKSTKKRFEKYGIDISKGYPKRPEQLTLFLDDAEKIRNGPNPNFIERGVNADREKKALFAKAKEVRQLTKYVGTELVGVQLSELNEQELDELALLISERIVVFFRNQDLSPQKQVEIGEFFSNEIEKHPLSAQIPLPGVTGSTGLTTIWGKFNRRDTNTTFRQKGGKLFHIDCEHEFRGPALTSLHLDAIPKATSGDTVWASGYAAYDKLSPAFQKFLDGKTVVHRSAHRYYDRKDLLKGGVYIEREHPLIVTHPVTGWKSLFIGRTQTVRIKDLEPEESDTILEYLYSLYENNLDIQARFTWTVPEQDRELGATAIWDNRVAVHYAVADYDDDEDDRHGSRVIGLGAPPVFVEGSKSQREALNLN